MTILGRGGISVPKVLCRAILLDGVVYRRVLRTGSKLRFFRTHGGGQCSNFFRAGLGLPKSA